ncbi:hypothetical protein Tco_0878757 [Tanacetum coccineum]|uniref:Uncharacterized protein n=1 Tax=Tanacetum coccineum TaxID=301880 RepID=A0ABQ5BZ72_9ASTR
MALTLSSPFLQETKATFCGLEDDAVEPFISLSKTLKYTLARESLTRLRSSLELVIAFVKPFCVGYRESFKLVASRYLLHILQILSFPPNLDLRHSTSPLHQYLMELSKMIFWDHSHLYYNSPRLDSGGGGGGISSCDDDADMFGLGV